MTSKKVFNIKDKVFAKIRGYPAWPAIISGVKADTPSKQRYNVYFYGTGERAECKPEELFSYEENKIKLGKPNKRKYFAEALIQIEDDTEGSVLPEDDTQEIIAPSNVSNIEQESPPTNEVEKASEIEKINESNSETEEKLTIDESNISKGKKISSGKKSLGISISKGTKRKISDIKPEEPSKKSMTNKIKVPENLRLKDNGPIVLVETLKSSLLEKATSGQKYETQEKNTSAEVQTSEIPVKHSETLNTTETVPESNEIVLDDNKTVKSISKIKDVSTSNSDLSSSSSNVGHVSRSGRKIKPKKYSDYQNDTEIPKRSRLSKENPKSSEKQNNGMNESESEQNIKSKGSSSNSETRKTSKNHAAAPVPLINDAIVNDELENVNNEISEDGELSAGVKELMTDAISNVSSEWKKTKNNKISRVDLLHTEVDLLDYIHKLRVALRTDRADYDQALKLLDMTNELQINALMLKKHEEVVDTIKKITKYIGNFSEWGLNEQETIEHTKKVEEIRHCAESVYNKFISLFTVHKGQTFQEVFQKEVDDFYTKTKHLSCDQIYGITTDKFYN